MKTPNKLSQKLLPSLFFAEFKRSEAILFSGLVELADSIKK
jgi:hypothetical protein